MSHSQEYRARLASPEWQRMRTARIATAYGKCERCHAYRPNSLELHHRHYKNLGAEKHEDLELLCQECHQTADGERREQREDAWENRVYAWAESEGVQRRRGSDWWEGCGFREVEQEFERFLEDVGEIT
jgi:5-methylcytosine-specific restriction endonuclease McrA